VSNANDGEARAPDILQSRRSVWIAMSDLWLDNELQQSGIDHIASVLRAANIPEAEADKIFAFELAPVLGYNHLSVAGVWESFDADWVCREAERRMNRSPFLVRVAARLGITTYGARGAWARVKRAAYP